MSSIILIGFMGAGKSTIGRQLARRLSKELIDLDAQIVEAIHMPIADYFDQFGEAAFREQETAILAELATKDGILATGGGIVLRPENRTLLKQQPAVIYLTADTQVLIERIQQDTENIRPLAENKQPAEIAAILDQRIAFYEESAGHILDTTNKTPEEIVSEIIERLGDL